MACRAHAQVRRVGGLAVIVLSIQESERVARQLQGRAGRQGDPGETHTLVSLDDPIVEAAGLSSGLDAVRPLLQRARFCATLVGTRAMLCCVRIEAWQLDTWGTDLPGSCALSRLNGAFDRTSSAAVARCGKCCKPSWSRNNA